ncbi:response regulator [Heliobacillus mobilis]|uniref:Circadian input-output histidine kinase CikA n=1 Tax=Heliobacterium mobile TaxID=28064 RepID=A0A6I3SJV4_HELMO|nr:ATP-binding protein [Heliobacterium mobile]MTV49198.1 response regulator [Heliobacterium mobile]
MFKPNLTAIKSSVQIKWLIGIGLLAITLQCLISYYFYVELQDTLYEERKYQQELIEKNIMTLTANADKAYQIIEASIEEKMKLYTEAMIRKYNRDPNVQQWDLEALKSQFVDFDIYIIDNNFTVVHTTVPSDLHLDFKQKQSSGFIQMLQERLAKNEFTSDRFIISIVKKETRKFGYMPTPDHKYLFELGVKASKYTDMMQDLDLVHLARNAVQNYPSVTAATIYSLQVDNQIRGTLSHYSADSAPVPNKPAYIDLAKEAIRSNKTVEYIHWDPESQSSLTYRYIPCIVFDREQKPDYYNSRIIELVYNDRNLQYTLHTQSVRIGTGIIIVAVVLVAWLASMCSMIQRLEQARKAAEEANKIKSDFFSTITHEIRTPMQGIVGTTELLLTTPLTDIQRQQAFIIRDSAELMANIMNDILDFSKIEAGQILIETTKINLNDLLQAISQLITPKINERGLTFQCMTDIHIPSVVQGDPLRLKQVLLNLLNNAVKFTEAGTISLHICFDESVDEGKILRFEVHDTGIGISPVVQDKLFQPFVQADSSISRQYGGTGLGLSICKHLVELMGGHIGVQSTPKVGSTFWFTIPLTEEPLPSELDTSVDRPLTVEALSGAVESANDRSNIFSATVTSESSTSSSPSTMMEMVPWRMEKSYLSKPILIVDDHRPNRLVLRMQLETMGFSNLYEVTNGQKAVEAVQQSRYALILMDNRMPVLNGLQAAAAIRQWEKDLTWRSRIVIISGEEPDWRQRGESGIDDFLTKPMTLKSLRETVVYWLSLGNGDREPSLTPSIDPEAMSINAELQESTEDKIQELYAVYFQDTPSRLAALQDAIESNNAFQVRSVAHGLKSASAAVGAMHLYKLCRDLEMMAKHEQLENSTNVLVEIERQFSLVKKAFTEVN